MKNKSFRVVLIIMGIGGALFSFKLFKSSTDTDMYWAAWFLFLSLIMLFGGITGLVRINNAGGN